MHSKYKKGIWVIIIFFVSIILVFSSFYIYREYETQLITKEYLIEKCELSQYEYENIDLDALIEKYQLTRKSLRQVDMHKFLKNYKKNRDNGYTEDSVFYSYLLTNGWANGKITEEELDQIKVIVLYQSYEGYGVQSVVVDYEKEKIYYGDQVDLLYDGAIPTWTRRLREERKEIIHNMWDDCNILAWELEYVNWEEGYKERFVWELYIELENGDIKKYWGGFQGDYRPDGFEILEDTLYLWEKDKYRKTLN